MLELLMLKKVLIAFVILLVGVIAFYLKSEKRERVTEIPKVSDIVNRDKSESSGSNVDEPKVAVFAEGLKVPWAITFLPSGDLLVTEREGIVKFVAKNGITDPEIVAQIKVRQTFEGGLHGIALQPNFNTNKFVCLYYTYSGNSGNTLNRVSRFRFSDNKLVEEKIIVDEIPGASNHDGGRVKFGPDGFLYVTTGDAQEPSQAQDINSLAGKILRVDDEGNPAPGNSFGNRVYSYGHRNPEGISWDNDGNLWATEHGPSGAETGNDELNKIEIGRNYGWPVIRGKQTKEGMVTPVLESGRGNTCAPADIAYLDGYLYFTGLRSEALYRISVDNPNNLETFFKSEFGRLREVAVGPNNMIYLTTSNHDDRGKPKAGDDKIIIINPKLL